MIAWPDHDEPGLPDQGLPQHHPAALFAATHGIVGQTIQLTIKLIHMQNKLEKLGSFGTIIAAAACPVCFPKLALLGGLFGLGALAKYETAFFIGAQILVAFALIGHIISYKKHRNRKLLSTTIVSVAIFFLSMYVVRSEILSYSALIALIATTIWVTFESRRCSTCATSPE